ncbi:hypothetical protein EOD41_09790 [Mucilaginibacter limnophilus]|uniref:Lipoprotein n=1 Tax=Mucilaginibacter limnophilus TaxID=1932778 RepID=A0A437MTC4_9SPHI|nr:hypothetical protein [Mucilaginibacter limnophilus]RVU00917.1 hypothetical protein EOD41_09790 [Mucilaginibacter limnophilus]
MTKLNYPLLLVLSAALFISACKKDKKKEPAIDEKNLTTCPAGANCEYLFTEYADVSNNGALKAGGYRLFWNTAERPGIKNQIFIKAPVNKQSFELSANDIQQGKVLTITSCSVCNTIPFKPVGGWVKGKNTTPNVAADKAKWLVEATIYQEAENDASIKDTITLKQYFNANFVIN